MIEPTRITEETNREVSIRWSDDAETSFFAPELRRACPCASCVNEWTGEKILKDTAISDDLTFSDMNVVGRYALNFRFSDGHDTGIFTYKFLRELSERKS
ncbi:DUF971 domain-containing protein [soil metagenome]